MFPDSFLTNYAGSVLWPACRCIAPPPELEIVSKDGMTKKQLEIIMMVNISNKLGLFR